MGCTQRWQILIQEYSIKYSDQIKKITSLLKENFNIPIFIYFRIDNIGKVSYLTNHLNHAETYINQNYYLLDSYLALPRCHRSGIFLPEMNESPLFRQAIDELKNKFHWDIAIDLVEKSKDNNVVEICALGAQASSGLRNLCFEQPHLLKLFLSHFKNEMHLILRQMEEASFSLQELKGSDRLSDVPINPELETSALHNLLIELGQEDQIKKLNLLSQREKQLLQLLLAGMSAKDTAAILKLSPRTIESYIDNLKKKLSCWSKQDLYAIGRNFEELGLLKAWKLECPL